jgi:hypothetical protein
MTKKSRKAPSKPSIGRRLGSFLLWAALFLLLLVAADQALQRLTPKNSLLGELQDCYLDLRSRLLTRQSDSIEELLDQSPPLKKSYFYADRQGELHFVDSLQEVPLPYRNEAQPLAE